MFDPTLTIESGIERLGEILDGRAVEFAPGDPAIVTVQIARRNIAMLFRAGVVTSGRFFSFSLIDRLAKSHHRALYQQIQEEPEVLPLPSIRFMSAMNPFDATREAILNAVEHGGSRGVAVRHLVGTKGELYVVAQGLPGPPLEATLAQHQAGGLSNYFIGTQLRGCGFRFMAKDDASSVWYASPLGDSPYAILIFAQADPDCEVVDLETPSPPMNPRATSWAPENGTPDRRLWDALVNCDAGVADPRVFYADFFAQEGWSLEQGLSQVDARVREMFDINVRGFLGEFD